MKVVGVKELKARLSEYIRLVKGGETILVTDLETSAALRAVLERGTTPEGEARIAALVAPDRPLRTLDALHLAAFLLARRRIEGLELLTADERLRQASGP